LGERAKAIALFKEAEKILLNKWHFHLDSFAGFWFCELLLDRAEELARTSVQDAAAGKPECQKLLKKIRLRGQRILDRAARASLDRVQTNWHRIDFAFGRLILGQAAILEASRGGSVCVEKALPYFEQAVDELRRTGQQHHLTHGILIRARGRCLAGKSSDAQADLDEAGEIAVRCGMKLYLADTYLHRVRLFFREKAYPWTSPQADLAAARKLIEQCGYWRRKEELEDAEKVMGV
jgi:hypothetical protein